MQITQISVFLENKVGALTEITRILGENNIDIRALSIADTTDFGILRMIVNNPDAAFECIKKAGITVGKTSVIAIELQDHPGALHNSLSLLKDAGIGVEYAYAFITRNNNNAYLILRVENQDDAVVTLKEKGVPILESKVVYGV